MVTILGMKLKIWNLHTLLNWRARAGKLSCEYVSLLKGGSCCSKDEGVIIYDLIDESISWLKSLPMVVRELSKIDDEEMRGYGLGQEESSID
jgi:hypothetical protein